MVLRLLSLIFGSLALAFGAPFVVFGALLGIEDGADLVVVLGTEGGEVGFDLFVDLAEADAGGLEDGFQLVELIGLEIEPFVQIGDQLILELFLGQPGFGLAGEKEMIGETTDLASVQSELDAAWKTATVRLSLDVL